MKGEFVNAIHEMEVGHMLEIRIDDKLCGVIIKHKKGYMVGNTREQMRQVYFEFDEVISWLDGVIKKKMFSINDIEMIKMNGKWRVRE